MSMINERIFREYDIRGIVGKDLTREISMLLGKAFGVFLKRSNKKAGRISVGRDVRLSSEELAGGFIEGVVSTGLDVIDIGLCPTPLQYFSIFHLELDGGVMITGSHNPPEYNGFKISIGKETIHGESIGELKEMLLHEKWGPEKETGNVETFDVISAYREFMADKFSYLADAKYRTIKIVVDAGNGTAGPIVPELLESIGCEVIPLYCEPDGTFPNHHPDPTVVEYIRDLIRTTQDEGADFGVGYDGDADRIGLVRPSGDIVWGDQLMIILSRDVLKKNPGAKVIGDVKCSQAMFDDIKNHGGNPIMWKTGHSLVKQKMKEERALIAGEFSGHIFIADDYFGYDDAIYTTLRLVEILKRSGKGLNELLSDIPSLHFTPEIRIDCPDERKRAVVNGVVRRFKEYCKDERNQYGIKNTNDIDGVRIVFDKGWGLIRPSNTQPVVVMRVEAEDEESLISYKEIIENEINKAMNDFAAEDEKIV